MLFNIDLDRGVHSRTDPGSGADVYMYVDEPGVFRNAHGTEIDVELAKRAGFPVDELLKKRRVKEALKAAEAKVLEELRVQDGREKVVVKEKEGFRIVDMGYDRYQVQDPDGDALHAAYLGLREATILLDQLVPDPEEKEPKS